RSPPARCRSSEVESLNGTLQNLWRQRNNLHETALAQFACDRAEHARADRLVLIVDEHGSVAVEADVAAVAAPLLLDRPHNDRLHDLALLDVALGRRFLHRRGDDVAEPRVAAGRTTDRIDDRDLARAGVVGNVQDRSHLNHGCFSEVLESLDGLESLVGFFPSRPFPTFRTYLTL